MLIHHSPSMHLTHPSQTHRVLKVFGIIITSEVAFVLFLINLFFLFFDLVFDKIFAKLNF